MTAMRILVADDEAEIRSLLAKYLEREGYAVDTAPGGNQALQLFRARTYDLVVVDLMMPDTDGFEVCRQVRNGSDIPLLVLSAKDGESDKVAALMLGADDYITKPFGMNEFLARVRAHLRRSRLTKERSVREFAGEPCSGSGIAVNLERHEVTKNGTAVTLTPKEFDLLVFLMRNPGQVFTKSRIFDAVWGDGIVEDDNTVMVHIRRLRMRIEDDPSSPRLIKTVHGIGYCFTDEKN